MTTEDLVNLIGERYSEIERLELGSPEFDEAVDAFHEEFGALGTKFLVYGLRDREERMMVLVDLVGAMND